jgi:hypothetical protein
MKKTEIVCIIAMLFLFQNCKKPDMGTPAYAIGIISGYRVGNILGNTDIDYEFYVNGTEYDNAYTTRQFGKKWKVPRGNYNPGDQYMVQYNEDDPSCQGCSRMLFDYKVTDSADYKSYVNEFKTNPPN